MAYVLGRINVDPINIGRYVPQSLQNIQYLILNPWETNVTPNKVRKIVVAVLTDLCHLNRNGMIAEEMQAASICNRARCRCGGGISKTTISALLDYCKMFDVYFIDNREPVHGDQIVHKYSYLSPNVHRDAGPHDFIVQPHLHGKLNQALAIVLITIDRATSHYIVAECIISESGHDVMHLLKLYDPLEGQTTSDVYLARSEVESVILLVAKDPYYFSLPYNAKRRRRVRNQANT